MENSWQWIAAYFSVLRLGAVINPINILLTTDEAAYIAKDCGSKLVLTSSSHALAWPGGWIFRSLSPKSPLTAKSPGGNRHSRISMCFYGRASTKSIASWHRRLRNRWPRSATPRDTTGHPKGAVLTHRNIVTNRADDGLDARSNGSRRHRFLAALLARLRQYRHEFGRGFRRHARIVAALR